MQQETSLCLLQFISIFKRKSNFIYNNIYTIKCNFEYIISWERYYTLYTIVYIIEDNTIMKVILYIQLYTTRGDS